MKRIDAEDNRPYVVSGDMRLLMTEWAQNRGYTLPKNGIDQVRSAFTSQMGKIFPNFEFIPDEELQSGIGKLAKKAENDKLTPINLDGAYFRSQYEIGITRGVDENNQDTGLMSRAGFPSLETQLDQIQAAGIRRAVLIDDVVFTGGLTLDIIDRLKQRGIEVPRVSAGIAVKEGIEALTARGVEVEAVREYREGVIDEVCERDFLPGVPMGGRTLNSDPNIGVPYIMPYGNLEKWGSIPKDRLMAVSGTCNIWMSDFYAKIGKRSGKEVNFADLGRQIKYAEYATFPASEGLEEIAMFQFGPFGAGFDRD